MTNREFHFWLLGYGELCGISPDLKALQIIRNHLNLVRAVEGSLDETNEALYRSTDEALAVSDAAQAVPALQSACALLAQSYYTR